MKRISQKTETKQKPVQKKQARTWLPVKKVSTQAPRRSPRCQELFCPYCAVFCGHP